MKQVRITLPNEQLDFFIQLVEKLGFDIEEEASVPDSHKSIVRGRIRNSQSENLVSWKSAREELLFKSE